MNPHRLACSIALSLLLLSFTAVPVQAQTPAPAIDADFEKKVIEIIRKNPEAILEAIQRYRQAEQTRALQAQQATIKRLTSNPQAAIAASPIYGNGKLLLIEFSDFQCPYCAAARKNLKQFVDQNPDRVKLVYKHFPLTQIHDEALPAAKASWAAQQQGKFWEYHDALFDQQKTLNEAAYTAIAKALNLDLARFDRDRRSEQAARAVATDQALGEDLGVEGTPFMLFNGQPLSGSVPVAELEKRLANAK